MEDIVAQDAQVIALISACVCIAIFLASLASAGFSYKNEDNLGKALFFISIALIVLNTVFTAHALVLAFSIFVGLAGWAFAIILKNVFGVPKIKAV